MDVTKDNFDEILPEVLNEIETCSFVSIDTEITGLWRRGEPGQLDSQEEFYNMFLNSASDFICLQLGLTLFKMNPVTKCYKAKTYTFNLFPRQYLKNSSYSFACQSSSIEFLVKHNFDFNKAFYKGITYLNIEREAQLSEMLEEKRYYKEKNSRKEAEKIDIPDEHKKCIEEACDKLAGVLSEDGEEETRVAGLNAYVRKLVYQTIKERYPDGEVLVDTRDGVMVGRKGNIDGHSPKSQIEIDEEEIAKAVGFSKVIRAISKSRKMIVGHNMFLDLCHIIHHYLVMAPKTYAEFKELITGVFPLVLDTKFMASSNGFKDLISNSVLNKLYSRLTESPFAKPDIESVEGYSYSDDADNYHDAGFDSYITGLCFISMYNYVGGSKDSTKNIDFKPKLEKISRFINRVFMNNAPDNHFNFGGQDPEPNRDHFFHVTFPKDWITNDIIHLFSPYCRVNVSWINETSAWVCLMDQSQSSCVRSNLCYRDRQATNAVVTPFSKDTYMTALQNRKRTRDNRHHQSSPQLKRRRSSRDGFMCQSSDSYPENMYQSRYSNNKND